MHAHVWKCTNESSVVALLHLQYREIPFGFLSIQGTTEATGMHTVHIIIVHIIIMHV